MNSRTDFIGAVFNVNESLPRVRGKTHRNPGLDAREKLPPVVAEPEMTATSLHPAMMSVRAARVKRDRPVALDRW